jgi:hypothetical protein
MTPRTAGCGCPPYVSVAGSYGMFREARSKAADRSVRPTLCTRGRGRPRHTILGIPKMVSRGGNCAFGAMLLQAIQI